MASQEAGCACDEYIHSNTRTSCTRSARAGDTARLRSRSLSAPPFYMSGSQLFFVCNRRSLGVRSQRDEREVLTVHVIHEVEHAGEAGAGVPLFIPGTVAP